MAQLKLKVKKANSKKPVTKEAGFVARVLTNGTAEFDDIVKEAGHNTTMHKAELRMAFELCMDSVTEIKKTKRELPNVDALSFFCLPDGFRVYSQTSVRSQVTCVDSLPTVSRKSPCSSRQRPS